MPAPAEHEAARAHVDEVFLSVPLPSAVADAVDRLVAEVAGARATVAVRSSATAEDLGAASFAGQYESYLNVEPADAHDAVRKVWASLWYPSPRSYRWFRGIDERDLAMAAVVMRMLDPSIAGVLFTVDPGGTPDAVRLEVVRGSRRAARFGCGDARRVRPRPRRPRDTRSPRSLPPLADLAREAIATRGRARRTAGHRVRGAPRRALPRPGASDHDRDRRHRPKRRLRLLVRNRHDLHDRGRDRDAARRAAAAVVGHRQLARRERLSLAVRDARRRRRSAHRRSRARSAASVAAPR